MTGAEHLPHPQHALRVRALLVLGLLVGLLGMHGLAPGGLQPDGPRAAGHGTPSPHAPAPAPAHAVTTASAQDDCGHDRQGGGCHDGAVHADATCASGAVSTGPTLPALMPVPGCLAAAPESVTAAAYGTPDGARAPPSLAELQLLRI